ncbi:MAG: hypothetical protein LBS29_05620 [Endomicrobium sp.]|jgi:hypothetical protein|nr:hypothetical protein [Endomicrobium sp.]
MKKFALAIAFTFMVTISAFSQGTMNDSFKGRIALGTNTTWIGSTAVAARYYLTDIIGLEGFLSFRTVSGNYSGRFGNAYAVGIKALRIIKSYKKLKIYTSSTVGLHSGKSSQQDVTLIAGLGLEWFVLDNLSLSSECGLRLTLGNSFTRFASDVDDIPNVSIRFYL